MSKVSPENLRLPHCSEHNCHPTDCFEIHYPESTNPEIKVYRKTRKTRKIRKTNSSQIQPGGDTSVQDVRGVQPLSSLRAISGELFKCTLDENPEIDGSRDYL